MNSIALTTRLQRLGRILLLPCVCLVGPRFAVAEPSAAKYAWLVHAGSANRAVNDKRFEPMVRAMAPKFDSDLGFGQGHTRLATQFIDGIGVPAPESISVTADRYIALGGCQPHDCLNKSYFWVDSKNDRSVGAIVHFIFNGEYDPAASILVFSNAFDCSALPSEFIKEVNAWLQSMQVEIAHRRFVGRRGTLDTSCFSHSTRGPKAALLGAERHLLMTTASIDVHSG